MQKTKTISFVLVLVLLSTMFLAVMLSFDWGSAQAETSQGKMTSAELFSATNTYNCNVAEVTNIEGKDVYNVQYDMSFKNGNQVLSEPQITVLTPGLLSKAAVWSNQFHNTQGYEFKYDEKSLIEVLRQKTDADMYRVLLNDDKSISIYSEYDIEKYEVINSITDISKHIIIVFEPIKSSASNDGIYYEFNHVISNIVLQVKELNGGILPKLNLIGHSRGGLTNMQYALDHPDMVESLISIGTPYFSSNMANMFGEIFMGKNDGLDDIVDQNIYMQYYRRWNDNYDNLYKDINAVAIGGYSSATFLPYILYLDKSGMIQNEMSKFIGAPISQDTIKELAKDLEIAVMGVMACKWLAPIENTVGAIISRVFESFFPNCKFNDFVSLLTSELGFTNSPPFTAYFGDVLVPLDSQLGIANGTELINNHKYKGFKRYKRYFTEFNSDFNRVAQAMPPATHNLEPRDSQIIQWVCNEVNIGYVTEGFRYRNIDETSIAITGYYGKYELQEVVVPAQIDGFNVVAIDDNAFNESWFRENMTKVILPSSVKSISDSAFGDCVALKSVEFDGESQLVSIGRNAFAGCVNLESLPDISEATCIGDGAFASTAIKSIDFAQYPQVSSIGAGAFRDCTNLASIKWGNVTRIGENAFWGCEDLTSVAIPQGIVEIGAGAFANCLALTHINVDSSNNVYKSISGVLYSKDGSTICQYPAGQAGYMYVVPDYVVEIDDYAFWGSSLSDIRLNKNLQRIGNYAFCSNKELPKIIIYKEVLDIGNFAFADCSALTKVTLFNPNANHLADWAFENINQDAKFYVTNYALSKNSNKENFNKGDYFADRFALQNYKGNLYPIEYYIHYYDGDKLLETRMQYYLSSQIVQSKKEGYKFSCWHYKGTKTVYNSADYVESEEISLEAQWITKEFVIKFSRNKSASETEYGYLSIINGVGNIIMQPTKVAYGSKVNELIKDNIMNWYYNEGRYYEGKVLEGFNFSYSYISQPSPTPGGDSQGSTQDGPINLVGPTFDTIIDYYDYSAVYDFVESLINEGIRDFGLSDEINITPIFTDKQVEYNFNSNGGQLTGESKSQKKFGDLYSLPIPEGNWGYNFLGWKIDSITAKSNKYDVSKLPKFTSSNNSYIGKIYNFATVPDLIYKVPFDYAVNLIAQWKYEAIDMYALSGSDISGGNTKWLDFSRYPALAAVNKTFKVASTVNKLYIKSMSLLENVSFDILGDCTIVIEQSMFSAPQGKCGIDATGKNLKIISIGTNLILGGNKLAVSNSTSASYCAGIVAYSLTIESQTKENEFLSINGGKGVCATTAGTNGGIGGVGVKVNNIEFVSGTIHIFGGTGGTGAKGADAASTSSGEGYTGGTGGNGGTGGYGLYFEGTIKVGANADVMVEGGAGGAGGTGGTGGKGADGKFANPAKKGGTGGKGGNGGNGGYALLRNIEVADGVFVEDLISLYGGDGGAGGAGGTGGSGGKKYLTSNHADQGNTGAKGSNGSYGGDYIE